MTSPYELKTMSWDLSPSGLLVVTMNNPTALNPMTFRWAAEMFFVLEHAERLSEVKVVVLTGSGRAFSAGASSEMLAMIAKGSEMTPNDYKKALGSELYEIQRGYDIHDKGQAKDFFPDIALEGLALRFLKFPKILIAAVNGLAVGGGANIPLLLADITFTCSDSKFIYPFAQRGVPPELGSSLLLPFLIGLQNSKKFMLLGEEFGGQEAERLGLVYKHISENGDTFLKQVISFGEKLAKDPILPGRMLVKKSINDRTLRMLDGVMRKENMEFVSSTNTPYFKTVTQELLKKLGKTSKL